MTTPKNRRDFYTGIPWVNVSPAEARNHPQGQLNLLLWAIAAYFLVTAVVKFVWTLNDSAGLLVAVLGSIWPFLAGVGLALRVPWAVVMAIVSTGLTAWLLVRSLGGGSSEFILAEMLINVGILFYLMDADKPNLIYRHRYRQYSAERGGDGDA